MYFFQKKGKRFLDLTGDFVLTKNDSLVKTRSKSAGPSKVLNARYICDIGKMSFVKKIKTTVTVILFVWGKSPSLVDDVAEPFKDGIK